MLYFVVVARLTQVKKKLSVQALQPIEDMLRKLGLGGERGYGVLQDRCTVLLFAAHFSALAMSACKLLRLPPASCHAEESAVCQKWGRADQRSN